MLTILILDALRSLPSASEIVGFSDDDVVDVAGSFPPAQLPLFHNVKWATYESSSACVALHLGNANFHHFEKRYPQATFVQVVGLKMFGGTFDLALEKNPDGTIKRIAFFVYYIEVYWHSVQNPWQSPWMISGT